MAKPGNWFSMPVVQEGKLSIFAAEVLEPVAVDGKPTVRIELREGNNALQVLWPIEAVEALSMMLPNMLERL